MKNINKIFGLVFALVCVLAIPFLLFYGVHWIASPPDRAYFIHTEDGGAFFSDEYQIIAGNCIDTQPDIKKMFYHSIHCGKWWVFDGKQQDRLIDDFSKHD